MSAPDARAQRARFAVAVVITSALAAGAAVSVRGAIDRSTEWLFGHRDVLAAFREMPAWERVLAPALGALVGALIAAIAARRLPPSHGVGDVMESVALGRGRVSLRAAIAKTASAFCAIVSGGSLGREGPLIQLGAALGGTCGRALGISPSRTRILLATGTAAGFAAAYNTPIAAALFVLEIVTGVVALEVIIPVVVGAAVATALSRLSLGEGPFYGLRTYALVSPTQLASSVVLGPLGGLAGVLFMQLLSSGEALFAKVRWPKALRAALGGAIVGALAIAMPEVTGNGAEAIRELLDGRVLGIAFLALLVAKPIATTASVSSGSAGGVFTPSMFVGAALGGGLASMIAGGLHAEREAFVGAFALVGMAAVVAATTHAPLMATVLAFEMSGDYALVIPLLAATSLATATARAMRRESIYAAEMRRKGVPWDGSLAHRMARAVRARDVLEQALVLPASTPLSVVHRELAARRARVAYAVHGEGVVAVDFRTLANLHESQREATLGDAGEPVQALAPTDDLPRLTERLWDVEWGEAPVLDAQHTIVGIVTRRALLGALDRELLQRDLLLTRLTWSEAEPGRLVELPRHHRIATIDAPESDEGRPLDPLAIRRERGLWVLAVRAGGPRAPWRDSYQSGPIARGDRWLVIGPREAFEQLGHRTSIAPPAPV